MSLADRSNQDYNKDIKSDEGLKNFVKKAREKGVLADNIWEEIKPAADTILQLEGAVTTYRNDVKAFSKDRNQKNKENYEKSGTKLLKKLHKAIGNASTAHHTELTMRSRSDMEQNAVKSINRYLIDKIFVKEIAGLLKPDEYLLELGFTPPVKVLEKNYPDKIETLEVLITDRSGDIKDSELQKIKEELSINS